VSCVFVCLSVFFPHNMSKTDTASITELDIDMFRNQSQRPAITVKAGFCAYNLQTKS